MGGMKALWRLLWTNLPNHLLCNDGEEREEQVRDHLIPNEEAIEIPTENISHVERFDKNERYPERE